MKTVKHASFADYMNTVADKSLNRTCIFRGQRNSAWQLENRWKRFNRDFLSPVVDTGEVREELRRCVVDEFRLVDLGSEAMTEAEVEALSQHTGLPTRLMDWSYSPYIGLFFAYDAASVIPTSSSECAVFEIDIERFIFASCFSIERNAALASGSRAREFAFTKDIKVSNPNILEIEDRFNSRAKRQDGVFLILPDKYDNLEQFEQECIDLDPKSEFLTKRMIPNSERLKAIQHLQDMGCRSSSVYCDKSFAAVDATLRTLSKFT